MLFVVHYWKILLHCTIIPLTYGLGIFFSWQTPMRIQLHVMSRKQTKTTMKANKEKSVLQRSRNCTIEEPYCLHVWIVVVVWPPLLVPDLVGVARHPLLFTWCKGGNYCSTKHVFIIIVFGHQSPFTIWFVKFFLLFFFPTQSLTDHTL